MKAQVIAGLGGGYSVQHGSNELWVVRPDGTPVAVGHASGATALVVAGAGAILSHNIRVVAERDRRAGEGESCG